MVNENIIEKIKHLLALAEHPNSNPNEAALAMERAQTLLLQHNLDRATIADNRTDNIPQGIGVIDRTEANGYSWKRILLSKLAKSNLCSIVISPGKNQIHVFGQYHNVKVVLEMFDWIILQLIPMALAGYKEYRQQGGYESARTWNAGFYFGACETIGKRLAKPFEEFRAGTGHDLVVYNDKALGDAIHRVFPRLVTSRAGSGGGRDGRCAGGIAGNNVKFSQSRQLGNTMRLNAGH